MLLSPWLYLGLPHAVDSVAKVDPILGIEIGWYELDGGTHGWMCLPFGRDAREACEYIGKILQ